MAPQHAASLGWQRRDKWHAGWEKGKRKAVLRAGLQSPERVYSGLIGDTGGLLSPDEARVFQLHPPLPLHDQVCSHL